MYNVSEYNDLPLSDSFDEAEGLNAFLLASKNEDERTYQFAIWYFESTNQSTSWWVLNRQKISAVFVQNRACIAGLRNELIYAGNNKTAAILGYFQLKN